MITIENNSLIVKAKEEGGELCSIISKQTQLEYLWQAGAAWPKHAPVLFPVVGQLKNDTYIYNGSSYKLERHGFARTKKFELIKEEKDKMEFMLCADNETLQKFPFRFELYISYILNDKQLDIQYKVKNADNKQLLFSIGAHPAFRLPLHKHETYEDYHLEFNRLENASRYVLDNGMIGTHTKPVVENDTLLPLSKQLFYEDALVFKNLESTQISVCSKKYTNGLHFRFEGFPFFGIWAAKDADFICLEPWHGIADSTSHDSELEHKEGIIKLEPEKEFTCTYSIEPF